MAEQARPARRRLEDWAEQENATLRYSLTPAAGSVVSYWQAAVTVGDGNISISVVTPVTGTVERTAQTAIDNLATAGIKIPE